MLVSLAVHAALLSLLRTAAPEPDWQWPDLEPPTPTEHELPQIIEVTWIDTNTTVPGDVGAAVVASVPTRVAMASVSQGRGASQGMTTAADGTEPGSGSGEGTGSGSAGDMMKMRGSGDLVVDPDKIAAIANAPGHEPSQLQPSGKLHDAGNGKMRIEDSSTVVTVDRDGTAHFHDKRDFDAHIGITPSALLHQFKEMGAAFADAAQESEDMKRMNTQFDTPEAKRGINEVCAQYQTDCDTGDLSAAERGAQHRDNPYNDEHPKHMGQNGISIVSGRLDLTSYLMRKAGIDPNASKKLALLDATREERAVKGAAYKTEQLSKADELMQQNLQALWAGTPGADDRRAFLFAMWDECDEGDSPSGHAGDRARAMVIGWIHSHITYTPEQVKTFDAKRTSHQHFAP
ncbi:MAG: hypothetical protein QM831_07435 [Kofleriaceae bacterium]